MRVVCTGGMYRTIGTARQHINVAAAQNLKVVRFISPCIQVVVDGILAKYWPFSFVDISCPGRVFKSRRRGSEFLILVWQVSCARCVSYSELCMHASIVAEVRFFFGRLELSN